MFNRWKKKQKNNFLRRTEKRSAVAISDTRHASNNGCDVVAFRTEAIRKLEGWEKLFGRSEAHSVATGVSRCTSSLTVTWQEPVALHAPHCIGYTCNAPHRLIHNKFSQTNRIVETNAGLSQYAFCYVHGWRERFKSMPMSVFVSHVHTYIHIIHTSMHILQSWHCISIDSLKLHRYQTPIKYPWNRRIMFGCNERLVHIIHRVFVCLSVVDICLRVYRHIMYIYWLNFPMENLRRGYQRNVK